MTDVNESNNLQFIHTFASLCLQYIHVDMHHFALKWSISSVPESACENFSLVVSKHAITLIHEPLTSHNSYRRTNVPIVVAEAENKITHSRAKPFASLRYLFILSLAPSLFGRLTVASNCKVSLSNRSWKLKARKKGVLWIKRLDCPTFIASLPKIFVGQNF